MTGHLDVVLAARAQREGTAQRRTALVHRHIDEHALGVVIFQPAHEPFGVIAMAIGEGPDDCEMAVVAEPRNPPILFDALAPIAQRAVARLEDCEIDRGTVRSARQEQDRCTSALQIIVPNTATVAAIGRLGRRLAYLSTDGDLPAPPELVRFGQYLQFLHDHEAVRGQSLLLSVTGLLRRHYATGQSALEDENLASIDAWCDPPPGVHGLDAAGVVEDVAVGPLLQPDDDNVVYDLVTEANRTRRGRTDEAAVTSARTPLVPILSRHVDDAWQLLWRGVGRLQARPRATHVFQRWTDDRRAFTEQADWVASGGRRRAQDSARRAASMRLRLEASGIRLDAQEALDDPLVMATYEIVYEALRGTVVDADPNNRERPRRNLVKRPLLIVRTRAVCAMPPGKKLHWSTNTKVACTVRVIAAAAGGGSIVTLVVNAGMNHAIPRVGDDVCFSIHNEGFAPRLLLPSSLPWTHQPEVEPLGPGTLDQGSSPWEAASA